MPNTLNQDILRMISERSHEVAEILWSKGFRRSDEVTAEVTNNLILEALEAGIIVLAHEAEIMEKGAEQ